MVDKSEMDGSFAAPPAGAPMQVTDGVPTDVRYVGKDGTIVSAAQMARQNEVELPAFAPGGHPMTIEQQASFLGKTIPEIMAMRKAAGIPDTDEVISAGQFHGQPVSMVMDYLGIALATLANISERRIEQLVNPDLSSLPPFLTPKPGLNSGLMIAQVAAAALASENKVLAHPASVDTIPTSANQEDHVSMGVTAARKARTICDNVEGVLAIEYLCAAQARDFHTELEPGRGVRVAHALLRERVPTLVEDRFLQPDIEAARELVASGDLVAAVEREVGALAS